MFEKLTFLEGTPHYSTLHCPGRQPVCVHHGATFLLFAFWKHLFGTTVSRVTDHCSALRIVHRDLHLPAHVNPCCTLPFLDSSLFIPIYTFVFGIKNVVCNTLLESFRNKYLTR